VAETTLMRAWAEAASGRYGAARALAAPLLGSSTLLRVHGAVEVHLLDAEAALQAGDAAAGRAGLESALEEGRTLDLLRPFALAGPLCRALLRAHGNTPGTAFTERVAAACAMDRDDTATPLSERELVVLALLPSLLNAPAMADELVVSVNTVKSQIRSIYAKLGVSTRREAVSRAQDRGLLV
jgi:LuxR family maltose regulon positive regulatory protein